MHYLRVCVWGVSTEGSSLMNRCRCCQTFGVVYPLRLDEPTHTRQGNRKSRFSSDIKPMWASKVVEHSALFQRDRRLQGVTRGQDVRDKLVGLCWEETKHPGSISTFLFHPSCKSKWSIHRIAFRHSQICVHWRGKTCVLSVGVCVSMCIHGCLLHAVRLQ